MLRGDIYFKSPMKPLFTNDEFNKAKASEKLPCECYVCQTSFLKDKRQINKAMKGTFGHSGKFCSNNCKNVYHGKAKIEITCTNCQKSFQKIPSELSKSGNNYCSSSCNATYNNKHKTHGTRRSKLEIWLEYQLTTLYQETEIHFNRKDAIGSELDIYFPELRLAIELNGIFHCEPIFGQDKLDKIQANDTNKFKACADNNITLCMIDTSKQKYFKESTSKEFLDIIVYHVNLITSLRT